MSSGRSLYKIKHDAPECHSVGKSLQVFEDTDGTRTGYCFSCAKIVPLTDEQRNAPAKLKTEADIAEEMQVLRGCKTFDQEWRGITPEYWKHFGVRAVCSEYTGKVFAVGFPYTKDDKVCGFKIRTLVDKKMWIVGDVLDADPFGWARAKRTGASTLYVTEGELDAISGHIINQTLQQGTKYADQQMAIISINAGVGSAIRSLENAESEIDQRFQKVVLVFDGDKQGQDAVAAVTKVYEDCVNVLLPEKDLNACLTSGKMKAARDAMVFRATKQEPCAVLRVRDVTEDALKPIEWGKSYPWGKLTALTYGQRPGEVISVGGGTGTGKSTIAYEIAAWNAKVHKQVSFIIPMEDSSAGALRQICSKIDDVTYHIPDTEYDPEVFRKTAEYLDDYIMLWDPNSRGDARETWIAIKKVIRANGEKIDNVFLDNLTTLSEGLTLTEKNDFIAEVASDCTDMGLKFGIQFFLFSHLNSPEKSQKSHEAGGRVYENQFTGSRALQRYSHFMIGFQRNKFAVDQNCSYISLIKNRLYGRTGTLKTYYMTYTGRLIESEWADEMFQDLKVGEVAKKEKN